MKIGHKLSLGFVGLAVLIVSLGYFGLRTAQTTLEKTIGEHSAYFAEQVLDKIHRSIHYRIETVQAYATDELLSDFVASSNAQFAVMSDPNSYIEQVDKEWTAGNEKIAGFIAQLSTNKLAEELTSQKKFYDSKYSYPLFSEIFVTNSFGANIALTNKTTDYYQADEEWWQDARKDGLFVGNVSYDESSSTYSIDIGARIDDENGNFLGVIKAVLNIRDIINNIQEAQAAAESKTIQMTLIDEKGRVLYSTNPYSIFEDAREKLASEFGNLKLPKHKLYTLGRKPYEKNIFFAHAQSKNEPSWILLTETESVDIFAPIADLRRTMLLAGIAIMALALLASSVTYRSIVIPIAELQDATVQIAAGNLDTNLTTISNDEIGRLARSFQTMSQQLKKTIDDLNDEISERKKVGAGLHDSKRFLDNIFDAMQDGINVLDIDFNIVKLNSWMEKMYADRMPLVGNKCYKAYHNRTSVCPWCPSVKTLQTGTTHTEMVPYVSEGRQKGWFELTAFPLKNTDGKVTGVIEHVKDITEHKKAEQALGKSEQRFREVVENAGEWVWEMDANNLLTYSNPVVKKILGFSPAEIVGKKHFYDLFHPEDRETFKQETLNILAKRQPFQQIISRYFHKDGHTEWLSTSGVPILNERGDLLGYRGVSADITRQIKAETILTERAEQAMKHHNTLLKLSNMPEQDLDSLLRTTTEQDAEVLNTERVGVWFFTSDRAEIVCRDQFIRTKKSHESGESLKAKDYPRYFKSLENSRIIAANNALTDPRTSEFTNIYLLPQGVTSMIDVPIRLHGQIEGIICYEHTGAAREWTNSEQDFAASVADMISLKLEAMERKKAEQKLEKVNKDLKATVAELSQSNRQLQDFVHVAAHDLKTPVRGIGTLADWIVSDYGEKFDEQGREQVRLLKARVVRIDQLIDGILQFSKLVRTRQNEEQVNLNTLVAEVITKIRLADNIEIAVDSLPAVTCEEEHVLLVFQNLLSNAVKFMDKPKGLIKVGCVEQGDFWKFYICDNGSGIEKKHFERIFRIFQTLPRKDEPETAGIGLAVARKIVELYGGKIWVESQSGSGSTFFFTFPKKQEESVYANSKTHNAN
jgi:PAS domain S-box-containing protein